MDGSIRIWESETRRLEQVLVDHDKPICALAWSPNGAFIASLSADKTLVLRATDNWRMVRENAVHSMALAWSPDSCTIAAGNQLWDVLSGEPIREFVNGGGCADWSPDGGTLAVGTEDGKIHFVDPATGTTSKSVEAHEAPVSELAWSPDGRTIASTSRSTSHTDKTIRLWTLDSDEPVATWDRRMVQATDVPFSTVHIVWSPDGKRLASATINSTVVWNVQSEQEQVLTRSNAANAAVAWSPNGKWLAAVEGDNQILVWRTESSKLQWQIEGRFLNYHVACVEWSPRGNILAVHGLERREASLYSVPSLAPLRTIETVNKFGSLTWSPDGSVLATGHGNGIELFNFETGETRGELKGGTFNDVLAAWSPGGERLIASCRNEGAHALIWDALRGILLHQLDHSGRVAWSPDGTSVCVGGSVLDVGKGVEKLRLNYKRGLSPHFAWSPDGKTIAVGTSDAVLLFDAQTGQRLQSLPGLGRTNLFWSQDGRILTAISNEGELVALEVASRAILDRRKLWHTHLVTATLAFSPDGRTFAASTREATYELRDTTSGRRLAVCLPGHNGENLVISRNGHYVGTPQIENTIVYVVQTDKGQDTLTPEEFEQKFGWKNDPSKVSLIAD
jgi:WD40 repeat protein